MIMKVIMIVTSIIMMTSENQPKLHDVCVTLTAIIYGVL